MMLSWFFLLCEKNNVISLTSFTITTKSSRSPRKKHRTRSLLWETDIDPATNSFVPHEPYSRFPYTEFTPPTDRQIDDFRYPTGQENLHDTCFSTGIEIKSLKEENEKLKKRISYLEQKRLNDINEMLYSRPDFQPSMLYNHKTVNDIQKKQAELSDLQDEKEELQQSLDSKSIAMLRYEVNKAKDEILMIKSRNLQDEIDNVYNQINALKTSPVYKDLCDQREQIRLLRQSIELQVDKYRRKKIEYKALENNPDISMTKTELSQSISRSLLPGSSRFITISGVSKYVTEDDVRTVFDKYGFIYDVYFDGKKNVVIEFDESKAAIEALGCTSEMFSKIVLGKNKEQQQEMKEEEEEDYNDQSDDDNNTEVGIRKSSIIVPNSFVSSSQMSFE